MSDSQLLTVSQLNNHIKQSLQGTFPYPVWLTGEIQGFDRNKSKNHIFFEIVEKDPNSKAIVARIGLVIFAGKKAHIQQLLRQSENAFQLKDDIEVKFACRVDFYGPHGSVRLIVETIEPTYTLGKLAQDRQKLIADLTKAGTLEKNKKYELPLVPLKIGLVTSYDSAAYNDFMNELVLSEIGFQIYLRNALVQGSGAEKDVSNGIKELDELDLDVIIVTRGGGSIADLACFDSKMIAETIAECSKPVLTGIGHEINTTITDLAAHTFAKTPTAIAQFLIQRTERYLETLDDLQERLLDLTDQIFQREKQNLKDFTQGIQVNSLRYIAEQKQSLMMMIEKFRREPEKSLQKERSENLKRYEDILKKKPAFFILQKKNELQKQSNDLVKFQHRLFQSNKERLKNFDRMVELLHPQNTLKRGFSITRDKAGNVIRSSKSLKKNDQLISEFSDGSVQSQVS